MFFTPVHFPSWEGLLGKPFVSLSWLLIELFRGKARGREALIALTLTLFLSLGPLRGPFNQLPSSFLGTQGTSSSILSSVPSHVFPGWNLRELFD